jgi:hypothetical protein
MNRTPRVGLACGVMTDDILILVGASPTPLSRQDATWLIERLRGTYTDTADPNRKPALALAWALELALDDEEEEPLEFGLVQVKPILHARQGAALSPALLRLKHGLLRLGGEDR